MTAKFPKSSEGIMNNQELAKKLVSPSKNSRLEKFGKTITFLCLALIVFIVAMILIFVAQKGLSTFFVDKVNVFDFLFGREWQPSIKDKSGMPILGALPMISGSFLVTILSALVATPFAIGAAVFMTEISPKYGAKVLQPAVELLVGIPSVVYGFIGLQIVVPFVRSIFGGTGFGILSGVFVLFVMILPTVTFMTTDSLRAVPRHYREASMAMGATRWQTIWRVVLNAARPGIFTAVIFGMARAFGEALAIQMVVGNSAVMPSSLTTPAATLTSVLTMGIGNTVMGTVQNNVLWSLALVLLLMSLAFNSLVKLITKERKRNYER
ncbi:phosphate ABC superfamily ATP binding cassette transporter, permease protein [Streptococcus iniae 9117]|nr:phosphate ABC superfamily ATP binding cassette transporter, permease protein [Streptococcus iniae 9117]ESR10705.1 phosphate ABC transporter permease [Streptococcus iniae IUSA1]